MTSVAGTTNTALIKVQGLASGLHTEEIIKALMSVEEEPLARLTNEKIVAETQESALTRLQTSLQGLATTSISLGSIALFEKTQSVSSSEPSRVGVSMSGGAPAGGYQVEVSQLASAAQRSYTYTAPAAASAVQIEGHEVKMTSGETLAEFASSINSDNELTVFAAAVGPETLVLSERETGKQTGSYLTVTGAEGILAEKAGTAKEGTEALYSIDGISGSSKSNTLTEAIPGVTLTVSALTSAGAVSVDVTQAAVNKTKVIEAVKSFVEKYNSSLSSLNSELKAAPPVGIQAEAEARKGTLYGDLEMGELTNTIRQAVYTGAGGLPSSMASLADIGVSTGEASGSAPPTQSAIEGKLELNEAKLEEALSSNPEGVKKMLSTWGSSFQKTVETYSGIGGSISSRLQSDETQVSFLGEQMNSLSEVLALHQHNLEARFVALEATLSRLSSQSSAMAGQLAKLSASTSSSAATLA